jgi:hypothetical protein
MKRLREPISPTPGLIAATWYYQDVALGHDAAAEIRFGESYVLRYDDDRGSPRTDFSKRFAGRENLVNLYAMASRQADLLSEFLCLYRVVEAADGSNGTSFLTARLADVPSHSFGTLRVIRPRSSRGWVNAFTVYRRRARRHLDFLQEGGAGHLESPGLFDKGRGIAPATHPLERGSPFAEAGDAVPAGHSVILRVREPLLRERAGIGEARAVVQDIDEVCVGACHIIDTVRPPPDLQGVAQVSDAAVQVAKVVDRRSERVECMALDLGRTNSPGDRDRLFADGLRLLPEGLDHQDLAEAGRDPRSRQGRGVRRHEPDRLPAGLQGCEPLAGIPQVAA